MRFHFLTILALLSLCATESKAGEYDVSSVTELRAALSQAARDGGSNIISISSGHFEVADGDGPLLFVPITSASVLLRGAGIYETVLDGGQIDQILVVSGASSIIIEDLSMVNGRAPEGIRGGALFVQNSSLEVRRVRFAGNESSTGGAIATNRYRVQIEDSEFENNRGQSGCSVWHGGQTSSLEISRSIFLERECLGVLIASDFDQQIDIGNSLLVGGEFENGDQTQGALYLLRSRARLVNVTMTGVQRAISHRSRSELRAWNTIFDASDFDIYGSWDLTAVVEHSFLDPNKVSSEPVISTYEVLHSNAPVFRGPNDFTLVDHSILIDRGTATVPLVNEADLVSRSRNQGPRPDIGAYEATPLRQLASAGPGGNNFAAVRWSDVATTFVGTSTAAGSGLIESEVLFLPDSVRGAKAISDISGDGSSALAVFGINQELAPRLQIRDLTSGQSIRNQTYFDATWHPLDMAVLADLISDGSEDIGVLAENLSTGEIAVQLRDTATGSFIGNVFFLNVSWRAMQLLTLGEVDANPGQELGVLATNDAGQIVVMIKDATTNTFIRNVFFLNGNWTPIQAIVLDDISENGAQEIGLLAKNKDSGQLVVMVKDAATNTFLNNVFPLGAGWEPIKVVALPDENANGSQELAVLGVNEATGKLVVQVRDSLTGQFLRNLEPLGSNWAPEDIIVLPDIGGGIPGLSVLATRKNDDLAVVQTIEAISGDLISNVFPD